MLALFALMTVSACTPATAPGATASATYSDQATAKVTGVEKAKRLITLLWSNGQTGTVVATNAVQNFDQIKVGDAVKVDYQEQIDIEVQGSNATPIPGIIVRTAAERAAQGQKPSGAVIISAKRSVQIVSVDRASHTVTFRETDGTLDSLVVQNPDNFALADGLRPGTVVDVTETVAAAVAIQEL